MRRVFRIPFRHQHVERDVDDEIAFHLEMTAQRLVARGMTPDAARDQALRQFGRLDPVRDDCVTLDRERDRAASRTNLLDDLRQDVVYALRTLRRNRAFTAVILGALALGIGANTAIFTLIDAVVVRGLPVPHPEQLVAIGDPADADSHGDGSPLTALLSYPLYRDIRDHPGLFTGVLATGRTGRLDVQIDGSNAELEHPHGRYVTGNYFTVLGVPALRGRVFDGSEDATPGASPIATISYAYWTRRFHQDQSVIGKTIVIDNTRMTIIGVTPPFFIGEVVGESADIWLPASMHDVLRPSQRELEKRTANWLLGLGRLAPGVTLAQARQELGPFIIRTIVANAPGRAGAAFLAGKPQTYIGPGNKGFSVVRDAFETPLFTLMSGVVLLLCIVCTNVANLLLARAIARGKEMAVRLALGADRSRLVRQLLAESLVLAILGAAAGLVLALWGSRALLLAASEGSTIPLDLSLDGRVLAFTLAMSLVSVALFGVAPALRASRVDYATALRAGGRSIARGALGTRQRVPHGSLLIAGQVALSVVLLVGAAMLTRSLRNVQSVEVGLDRDHLLILNLDINARGYSRQRLVDLAHTMRDRLAATPGVNAVTYSENGIFSGTEWHTTIKVPGFTMRAASDSGIAEDNVGPGYVHGIGGRLLAGRDIAVSDETRPGYAALVNEAFAKFYFPTTSAVGKYFYLHDTVAVEIVGVMADVHDHRLDRTPDRRAYYTYAPMDTLVSDPSELRFVIRTNGDPAAVVANVRAAVRAVDPLLPIDTVEPLSVLMRQSIREERLVVNLASAFGALALLLAAIGLYGVMTYAITRRTAELGLRAALGAQAHDVVRMVLSDALRLVAMGMIIGVPLALAATRLLRAQLHGVPAVDPASIAAALLVLATSAVVAVLLPAVRASRVSPLVALQAE